MNKFELALESMTAIMMDIYPEHNYHTVKAIMRDELKKMIQKNIKELEVKDGV